MLLKPCVNLKTKTFSAHPESESPAHFLLTQQNVRTLKRLARRFVPAVRLYIHSDEIQSTVTELLFLSDWDRKNAGSVSLFPTA
jgi:hypothetical protein